MKNAEFKEKGVLGDWMIAMMFCFLLDCVCFVMKMFAVKEMGWGGLIIEDGLWVSKNELIQALNFFLYIGM